ncbi:uncharacterized protein LOC110809316 [Carica papaya]|uniref:uncharacterized protein LOC110809316 n=1 Tax=Carica papaya TaxID=3649 RepID=UPI000B8CC7D3|nr:uncharacterized protein LOC110809316 [Carica papaya]
MDLKEEKGGEDEKALPVVSLNHVSRLCRNVKDSIDFYTKVLGFVVVERPQTFDFDGAWLFNYGVGIHLIQSKDENRLPPKDNQDLDPMDNHISFQSEDLNAIEERLKDLNVKYEKRRVEDENGVKIDQLFFKDPDGHMVEICNCENLKLVPASSLGKIKLPIDRHTPPIDV